MLNEFLQKDRNIINQNQEIQHQEIQQEVRKLIELAERNLDSEPKKEKDFWLKTAEIIKIHPQRKEIFFQLGEETKEDLFIFNKKSYPTHPNLSRTIFCPELILDIDNEEKYIEVKGLGANGKKLFLKKHREGDMFYGCYLENVIRSYSYLKEIEELNLDVKIPSPVAVLKIQEQEYFKYGIKSLEENLPFILDSLPYVLKNFSKEELLKKLKNLKYKNFKTVQQISKAITTLFQEKYFKEGKNGLKQTAQFLGLRELVEGFTEDKEFGYIIRMVRSPKRIGDLFSIEPKNIRIAKQEGKNFRILLENGFLHTTASLGNWTSAEELNDFEDVYKIKEDKEKIEKIINFFSKEYNFQANLKNFLELIIGPEFNGKLSPYFIEGLFGEKITMDRAVQQLLNIYDQNFKS